LSLYIAETLPSLPYSVLRTTNKNLPVYTDIRNGRTRRLTLVRRIFGNTEELKNELMDYLKSKDVSIRKTTGHIWIKGDRRVDVLKFLNEKGF
ncbi:ribosomal protein L49/IMG2, partial [Dimargaris cristalligena]